MAPSLPPAVAAALSTPNGNYELVLEAVRKLVLRAAPPVGEPGPNQVLLQMKACGICGSDCHQWQGFIPAEMPQSMGHEGAGIVVKVGSNVKHLAPGDVVAIEPLIYDSEEARAGNSRGMVSRFYIHAAHRCHKMNVSPEEAAYMEPLAVGMQCAIRGGVTKGSKVVILGAGPVGLNVALSAKALGAEWIAIADINQGRLDMARRYTPVDRTINTDKLTSGKAAQKIIETIGFQPTIVLDAAGFPTSIDTAIRLVKQFGTVSLVGVPPKVPNANIVTIVMKEINFLGSFGYGPEGAAYARCVELVNSGKINVKPLITDLVGLEDVDGAFRQSEKGGSTIKVMFRLPDESALTNSAAL